VAYFDLGRAYLIGIGKQQFKGEKLKKPERFVSLHSHTGFSAMDGLDPPETHIDFIRQNGMDGWCLTEHGHMNSFAQAYLHVQKLNSKGANFKFVPGCEMYLHPDLEQWNLHQRLRKAAKDGDKAAMNRLRDELRTFTHQVVPILDDDDDIVDMQLVKEDEDNGEVTITIESEEESKKVDSGRFSDPVRRRHHLVVLPRNSRGLHKLFALVSRGYREGFYRFPRIDYRMLKEAAGDGDLIASTACLAGPASFAVFESLQNGDVHSLTPDLLDRPEIRKKMMAGIGNMWDQLTWAVGEEFAFLEIQFNRLPAQHLVNRALLEFASNNGLLDRLVVTADSHYPSPERWRDREVYKGLGYSSWKELGPNALPLNQEDLKCELYPKNASQLWDEYLGDKSVYGFYEGWEEQVANAVERTHSIVHDFIEPIHPDRSVKLPTSILPPKSTPLDALIKACKEGLKLREVEDKPEYVERLKTELKVISEKGFELYFLTEQKIMQLGKQNMLCGPGRGSAAGSLVCWLLEITEVDPIQWNLSFERFLSPSRTDLPDVDSDFQDRDAMVSILQDHFGEDNVIPISSYGRMQVSTSTKDVAKLLDIPYEKVNAATKGLDFKVKSKVAGKGEAKANVDVTYELAYEHHQPFRELMDEYPELANMVNSLGKQIKSIGRHAGGVLVSENVPDRMPVILSRGRMQTPWIEGVAGKQLEPFGWVKFDILGLETLEIIHNCIVNILRRHHGKSNPKFQDVRRWYDANLDPKAIDFEDEKVYKHVYDEGRWFGIFQCTQHGAQKFFQRAQPRNIIDIATLTSIYRPGPLGADVDKLYVQQKNDPSSIPPMHPLVWEVLKPTYGLLIFQEQVMELAHVVASIPLEECDDLRRGITKSAYAHLVPQLKERFVSGAVKNGLREKEAVDLWETMIYFSAYGFNKSHAVSYAMVSYYCAWLLTYYEDEWVCAWAEKMSGTNEDRALADRVVRRWGGKILPIDARYATEHWQIIEPKVYMPSLASAQGVGKTALRELIRFRPFKSMQQLLYGNADTYRLSKLNKKALESLIRIGAFDCFIGEDKEFANANHMLNVVIKNGDKIRKVLKKNPAKGKETYLELCATGRDTPERSRSELIKDQQEILGMVNPELLVSDKLSATLSELEVPPMDEIVEEGHGICWFTVNNAVQKTTKNGKPYLLIEASDSQMAEHKIYVWNFTGHKKDVPQPWSIMVGKITSSDFGWKGFWNSLRVINSDKI
jgi:DNA polymerase III subunit alpha